MDRTNSSKEMDFDDEMMLPLSLVFLLVSFCEKEELLRRNLSTFEQI